MIKYAPATEGAWHQKQLIWKVTTVGEGNFLRFHHARWLLGPDGAEIFDHTTYAMLILFDIDERWRAIC